MGTCRLVRAALVGTIGLSSTGPGTIATVPQHDRLRSAIDLPSADISADGRYVAFESYARLVAADTDDARDVYVLDRLTGVVNLETRDEEAGADYAQPRISGDGRFLAYERSQLIDHGRRDEILLTDRRTTITTLITTGMNGERSNGPSRNPDVSDDGRFVTFASSATNLVKESDVNGAAEDIYLYIVDRSLPSEPGIDRISRINLDDDGVQPAAGHSFAPAISGDGRSIAFTSTANLDVRLRDSAEARASRPTRAQVFVRDRETRTTRQISVTPAGRLPNERSWGPAISADGRHVAFVSAASNLVDGDRNRQADVFLADLQDGSTLLVSRGPGGGTANGASIHPVLSGNGRFVAFQSDASNLVCRQRCQPEMQDINLLWDVFVFDRGSQSMVRVSEDARGSWMEPSGGPRLTGTGYVVVFSSRHAIDPADNRNDFDLFVRAWPPAAPTITGERPAARTAPR